MAEDGFCQGRRRVRRTESVVPILRLCPFASARCVEIDPIQETMEVEIRSEGVKVKSTDLPKDIGMLINVDFKGDCGHHWAHRFAQGKDGVYVNTLES